MHSRNLDPKLVRTLVHNYKCLQTSKARRIFIKEVSAHFDLRERELKNRMKLELVLEDIRPNRKEVQQNPNQYVSRSFPTPSSPSSSFTSSSTSLLAHASSSSSLGDGENLDRAEPHTREAFLETYQIPKDAVICKFCREMGYGRAYYTSHIYASPDGDIACPSWHYLQRRNFDYDCSSKTKSSSYW